MGGIREPWEQGVTRSSLGAAIKGTSGMQQFPIEHHRKMEDVLFAVATRCSQDSTISPRFIRTSQNKQMAGIPALSRQSQTRSSHGAATKGTRGFQQFPIEHHRTTEDVLFAVATRCSQDSTISPRFIRTSQNKQMAGIPALSRQSQTRSSHGAATKGTRGFQQFPIEHHRTTEDVLFAVATRCSQDSTISQRFAQN